eukprot:c6398_g1_i1.p1 GENE.c6398_g1_i1~~c6398_g1_i1.p1  ORF type:complete len:112 (-),score=18.97 c6398_g1_i1:320-655(-)
MCLLQEPRRSLLHQHPAMSLLQHNTIQGRSDLEPQKVSGRVSPIYFSRIPFKFKFLGLELFRKNSVQTMEMIPITNARKGALQKVNSKIIDQADTKKKGRKSRAKHMSTPL